MSDIVNRRLGSLVKPGMVAPVALAAVCFGLLLWGLVRYPLPVGPLAAGLLGFATALWRWPALFLLVLPIVVPACDLGLWTGWMDVGESDLFILTSMLVLVLRVPLRRDDLTLPPWPRAALLALVCSYTISAAIGLGSPLGAAHSDNPLLRPDNALRLAKGFVEALALLAFMCQRQRSSGDAVTLLGWGLAAGLGVVTLIVLAERMLFASALDFTTAYRVAGPFSSMRVGGGHIGAYAALALPFSATLLQLRPRWLGAILALLAFACGGYTLAVTFARAAYAACLVGMVVTGLGWAWAANRARIRSAAGLVPIVLVLLVLAVTAGSTGMQTRFADSVTDLATRQDNWRAGLAVRDRSMTATLFGMGLGSYQRAMLTRSAMNRPSDLVLQHDDTGPYVSVWVETPFFLGQKIGLPQAGALHLTLRARSPDAQTELGASVCDKVLLYSDHCRGSAATLREANVWVSVQAVIPAEGLGGRSWFGLLRRPVELSLFGPVGHRIELREVVLLDDRGDSMLANGDFARGLDRWIFTDDSHVSWRMLNQYLMAWFETGALGLTAFCLLAGVAIVGGIRALGRGVMAASAVVGGVTSFMVSSLFDNVLEAPRLALLFFLVSWCGLLQWQSGRQ
jgi:hypothetical protein